MIWGGHWCLRCLRNPAQRPAGRWGPLALVLLLALTAAATAVPSAAEGASATATAATLPSFEAVRAAHAPSDIALLSRQGVPMQPVRIDPAVRRGPWLSVADISPALRHALVLSEDRRFWDHHGVDWRAMAASAWGNAWNQKTRGASTLTMQLAGLLDDELARPAGGRSVATKMSQMISAQALESGWTKTQILEAYLNHVPLRGELVGVAAASQQLFGKHASGLDSLEAAVLAAMVRAPNAKAPLLERRACAVLQQQAQRCDGLATAIEQALARRPGPAAGEALAPHLALLMMSEAKGAKAARATQSALSAQSAQLVQSVQSDQGTRGESHPASAARPGARSAAPAPARWPPLALHSTLDANTQRLALSALRRQLAELRGRNAEDGAVVVLDNSTGDVLAWVGSSATTSMAAEVDAVQARRQPGSTLKPFVYALALQKRLITPTSLLEDSPLQLATNGALYQPQNYDHGYRGWVSARTALASSLNVPAVRVANMLGPDALFDSLNQVGLRLDHSAGFHGLALALGSADVTLLDLSNAYRTLARQGLHSAVRWRAQAPLPASKRVLPATTAWQVAQMLADPAARAITFGLDSPLVTRGWAAVKTGTSKDMRDNWCIGFTSRYTVGVWVGNASGAPMHGVSGVSGAAPVWRELVAHLHAQTPSAAPAAPAGLVSQGGDWFAAGTEPGPWPHGVRAAAVGAFGIQAPRAGSVIVLDPEIPMAAQRMVFVGQPGQWWVDGRPVGSGSSVTWLPRPGRHVLQRRSAEGTDQVVFDVRAAPIRTGRGSGKGKG